MSCGKEERARGILGGRFEIVNNQLDDEERSKQVPEEEDSFALGYMIKQKMKDSVFLQAKDSFSLLLLLVLIAVVGRIKATAFFPRTFPDGLVPTLFLHFG